MRSVDATTFTMAKTHTVMRIILQPDWEKEQDKTEKLFDELKKTLKKADKEDQKMQVKANTLAEFIQDSVTDFAMRIKKDNAEHTLEIEKVPLIRGPPGPPGEDGKDGSNGAPGVNGENGVQGPDGPAGTCRLHGGVALISVCVCLLCDVPVCIVCVHRPARDSSMKACMHVHLSKLSQQ